MKRQTLVIALSMLMMFSLCCKKADKNTTQQNLHTETDATGKLVSIDAVPERIISLAPNITQILIDLGLKDKLVGISQYYHDQEKVKGITVVGGYINPSIEKIISLEPDIVFAARGNPLAILETLRASGITVFAVDVQSLDDLYQALNQLGNLTDTKQTAQAMANDLTQHIDRMQTKLQSVPDAQRPRVLCVIQESPLICAGANTIIDELITIAGGRNVAHDQDIKWPTLSHETLLLLNPDVIVLTDDKYRKRDELVQQTIAVWQNNPVWKNVAAVGQKRVHYVAMELIGQPSALNANGLDALFTIMHPNK